ncbi:MAG: hypothetical protein U5S82_03015 [Gammaproteobacteria bacterium]|nr:hypothetical protein [Gammaproteobacteria bacterium]
MKTRWIRLATIQALMLTGVLANASEVDEFALEPCINGGVSASGLFASQAEEDRYHAEQLALELEPCINGDVSATGLFLSQAEEDTLLHRLAGS